MPRFESPLGSKKFEGQQMREFDVPDETPNSPTSTQNRRKQQMEQAAGLNIDAIRAFAAGMNEMPLHNGGIPPEQAPMPQHRPTQRLHGMGGTNVNELNNSEGQIREMREIQRGRGRLSEGARRRLEILLGMVRDTRTVELPSGEYTLQTLRSHELREAVVATEPFDGTIQGPFEIRRQLLSRSLIKIAGLEIDQFVGSSDLEVKLEVIDQLPEALLSRLHKEYNLMVDEAREKYAIKNPEDAQQVLNDLKK